MSPFCGATDTPVLDFWWCLLWVSKPEWAALFKLGRGVHITRYLRFTSGVTPANLLAASMAAKPSLLHTCKALVGLKTGSYHAAAHSVRSGRPDALPTELSRLGFPSCNVMFFTLRPVHTLLAIIALSDARSSAQTFIHNAILFIVQCLIQSSSLVNRDVIFVDNC